jgi:5'-3' exoribonuclease 1
MGIPYYFYQVFKKYSSEKDLVLNENEIHSKTKPEFLFFDYNSLIHPCAKKTLDILEEKLNEEDLEEKIIQECLNYTRYIIDIVSAKNVYILIDGVAPRAKMNQQRQRRYKNNFLKEIIPDDDNVINKWDSNKITPGTYFMEKLSKALLKFKELMENESGTKMIISDSNEKGEGEHKMMKIISDLGDSNSINSHICIYGLDADLIMLSLLNKYSNNIVLIRDNNKDSNFSFLNICKLKECIVMDMNFYMGNSKKNIDTRRLIEDYILLLFFIGNDFLHHLPSIITRDNGIHILLKTYGKIIKTKREDIYLTNKSKNDYINLELLEELFEELGNSEDYFFKNIYSPYQKQTFYKDSLDISQKYSTVFFYTDDKVNFNKSGYKQRYYNYYGIPISNMKDTCQNYLEGLYWILGYYRNHEHNNWTWYYKYENTPFISDLYLFLKNKRYKKVCIEETQSYSPKEQLIMVLPRTSLLPILSDIDKELHEKLLRLFRLNNLEMEIYFPTKIYLNMTFKEYLWQSDIFISNLSDYFLKLIY